jgi:hypothetical protein
MATAATPRENPNEAALRAQNETLKQQLEIQRQNFEMLKQRLGPGWGTRAYNTVRHPVQTAASGTKSLLWKGVKWGSLLIGAAALTKLVDRRFPGMGIQDKLGRAANWTIDNAKYGVTQGSDWLIRQADAHLPASIMDATKPPATPAP